MEFGLTVRIVTLGKKHLAITRLGGVTVRGRPADDAEGATRNLFWRLSGQDSDEDAGIAVSLALAGTTIDQQLALEDGGK